MTPEEKREETWTTAVANRNNSGYRVTVKSWEPGDDTQFVPCSLLELLVSKYHLVLPEVLNKHLFDGYNLPANSIYVGRPSPWGNPFKASSELQRDWACDQFEEYAMKKLAEEPGWLEPLRGKNLVCWCHPKRCHAHTLVRLANVDLPAVEAHFDGICEPAYSGGPRNPGGVAAGGWVVKKHPFWWSLMGQERSGNKVYRVGTGATNNYAEYEAALDCLREIYKARWRGRVVIYGDSKLVVNQFSGEWQCKSESLRPLREHLRRAAEHFTSVELVWVPRENNSQADEQSRRAYQNYRSL